MGYGSNANGSGYSGGYSGGAYGGSGSSSSGGYSSSYGGNTSPGMSGFGGGSSSPSGVSSFGGGGYGYGSSSSVSSGGNVSNGGGRGGYGYGYGGSSGGGNVSNGGGGSTSDSTSAGVGGNANGYGGGGSTSDSTSAGVGGSVGPGGGGVGVGGNANGYGGGGGSTGGFGNGGMGGLGGMSPDAGFGGDSMGTRGFAAGGYSDSAASAGHGGFGNTTTGAGTSGYGDSAGVGGSVTPGGGVGIGGSTGSYGNMAAFGGSPTERAAARAAANNPGSQNDLSGTMARAAAIAGMTGSDMTSSLPSFAPAVDGGSGVGMTPDMPGYRSPYTNDTPQGIAALSAAGSIAGQTSAANFSLGNYGSGTPAPGAGALNGEYFNGGNAGYSFGMDFGNRSWPAQSIGAVIDAAQKYGVDPRMALTMANAESGMNPNALNSIQAAGLFQIMPNTGPALGIPKNSALRFSPTANADAGMKFASQNIAALQNAGIANPTIGDVYGSHLLGLHGYEAIATADPNASFISTYPGGLGPAVAKANPFIHANMTNAQAMSAINSFVSKSAPPATPSFAGFPGGTPTTPSVAQAAPAPAGSYSAALSSPTPASSNYSTGYNYGSTYAGTPTNPGPAGSYTPANYASVAAQPATPVGPAGSPSLPAGSYATAANAQPPSAYNGTVTRGMVDMASSAYDQGPAMPAPTQQTPYSWRGVAPTPSAPVGPVASAGSYSYQRPGSTTDTAALGGPAPAGTFSPAAYGYPGSMAAASPVNPGPNAAPATSYAPSGTVAMAANPGPQAVASTSMPSPQAYTPAPSSADGTAPELNGPALTPLAAPVASLYPHIPGVVPPGAPADPSQWSDAQRIAYATQNSPDTPSLAAPAMPAINKAIAAQQQFNRLVDGPLGPQGVYNALAQMAGINTDVTNGGGGGYGGGGAPAAYVPATASTAAPEGGTAITPATAAGTPPNGGYGWYTPPGQSIIDPYTGKTIAVNSPGAGYGYYTAPGAPNIDPYTGLPAVVGTTGGKTSEIRAAA